MSNVIYTRNVSGLDKRVWYVLIATIIISFGLLGYRLLKKDTCVPVQFTIKSVRNDSTFYINEDILFNALGDPNNFSWDFGDHSEKVYGQNVTHKYKTEGEYFVITKAGLDCENIIQKITITRPVIKPDIPEFGTSAGISGDSTAIEMGEPKIFSCIVPASHYMWYIEGNPAKQEGPSASFTFPRAGTAYVLVYLDNDFQKKYRKKVIVDKKAEEPNKPNADTGGVIIPPPPPPPLQHPPVVDDAVIENEFKDNLKLVIYKYAYDPNNFFQYLCKRETTPATCARIGKKGRRKDEISLPLGAIIEQFKGKKTILYDPLGVVKTGERPVEILDVHVLRDPINPACIKSIDITYK